MKNTRNKMRKRNKQKMNATSEQHRWCWERTKRKHRLEFAETQAELLKTVQKEMRRVITSERKENEIQHNERWGTTTTTTTTTMKKTLYSFWLQYPSRCVGVCGCVCVRRSRFGMLLCCCNWCFSLAYAPQWDMALEMAGYTRYTHYETLHVRIIEERADKGNRFSRRQFLL